jgi:hypothetical protein
MVGAFVTNMMAQPSRRAIEASRDTNGVVHIDEGVHTKTVRVTFEEKVPLECDRLVQDGFLIRPSSAREESVTVYK